MIPGETILSDASPICCGKKLEFEVLHSYGGGWYIGTLCPDHGPYTRESGYFETEVQAKNALYLDPEGKIWRRR